MKIEIKNLGVLKQAEFSLGDMTIICGGNNTGKTYATYALFGFLSLWRQVFSVDIDNVLITKLLHQGAVNIDIAPYIKDASNIVYNGCRAYVKQLSLVFAAPADRFKTTEFQVSLDFENIKAQIDFDRKMRSANADIFSITKTKESTEITITLLVEKEKIEIPHEYYR